MFLCLFMAIILNIITQCTHKKWIKNFENKYKNFNEYDITPRYIISQWIITIVFLFIDNVRLFIIIYLVNYMYSRILSWLSIIECKIDSINSDFYNKE